MPGGLVCSLRATLEAMDTSGCRLAVGGADAGGRARHRLTATCALRPSCGVGKTTVRAARASISHAAGSAARSRPPSLRDFVLFEPAEIQRLLEAAGLRVEEVQEREPYAPEVEYQSRRAYILARKPAG